MGKRSTFDRRPQDAYDTIDPRAVRALKPHIGRDFQFIEPCEGRGYLARQLKEAGLYCVWSNDLHGNGKNGRDALTLTRADLRNNLGYNAHVFISNPPWTRSLLHPLILHLQSLLPTWLLFDSDWAYNAGAAPYLAHCSDIVAVGRLCWIEGTNQTGKDNCSWYRFDAGHDGPTIFHGRV